MRIRDAGREDAESLASLLAELGYPDEPGRIRARVAAFAADAGSVLLVAEDRGELVGLVSASVLPLLHEDGNWCRISALVVSSARRRDGAGRALLEAAEAFGRSRGCRYAEVTSGERAEREVAHRFYEALGYEQVSKRYLKGLA